MSSDPISRISSSNTHHMVTNSKAGIFKPKLYTTSISSIKPTTIQEAMAIPSWKENFFWGKCVLLVYVNDIIITSDSDAKIGKVVNSLHSQFSSKDLGPLSYFLGLEITKHGDSMHISQQKKIVDGLQYLCMTRPNITFVGNTVSQYMHLPSDVHWIAVKRILKYIRGTLDYGLLFQPLAVNLTGFSDVDWASSREDRKSESGFCIYLSDNLIGWSSKKQGVVSRQVKSNHSLLILPFLFIDM
ncbi:hypothetical protein J1N35_007637 [Gossypium stocksii]|uniref:Reverse transcriptase Ty1/copia-type domain-containing protein n=1 Tax=Gossypium stocksii TaxID=47602 RepID=A0A9D3W6V4_9ROSI|nr:hypothetical protein J1N35_007637 [Gossypium stocksii]